MLQLERSESSVRLTDRLILNVLIALFTVTSTTAQPFPANFSLADLDGTEGFSLEGVENNEGVGEAVSFIGDFNDDNFDDVAIGARTSSPTFSRAGACYIVFGNANPPASFQLANLNGSNGFKLNGGARNDTACDSVTGIGNFNNDPFQDFLVAAPQADAHGLSTGEAYIVYGSASMPAELDLDQLDGTDGIKLVGVSGSDRAAHSIAGLGDFNGANGQDIAIGAPLADPNGRPGAGEVYVVFGRDINFPSLELSALGAGNGVVFQGAEAGEMAGYSVGTAADINGDGLPELLIGAIDTEVNAEFSAGKIYVVYGRTSFPAPVFDLANLDPSLGFTITGFNQGDIVGTSLVGAGDTNDDGINDILIGASEAIRVQGTEVPRAYVVFGSDTPPNSFSLDDLLPPNGDGTAGFVIVTDALFDKLGQSVGATDINSDGFSDILISGHAGGAGRSYVVYGSDDPFAAKINISDLSAGDGSVGFLLNGFETGDSTSFSHAGSGPYGLGADFNNDDFDDLIIGAPQLGADAPGKAYIVFGVDVPLPLKDAGNLVRREQRASAPRAMPTPTLEASSFRSATTFEGQGALRYSAAHTSSRNGFTSTQVNLVNDSNVIGDAANEPGIAVVEDGLLIAWRQFDTAGVLTTEAAFSTSSDGTSWANLETLDDGEHRTDPSVDFDSDGNIYFNSVHLITTGFLDARMSVTADNGDTWDTIPSLGGDQAWIEADKSTGSDDIFSAWDRNGSCCGNHTFGASTDGGGSFGAPVVIEGGPKRGGVALGSAGEIYVTGLMTVPIVDSDVFLFSRADDRANPVFFSREVDLGGFKDPSGAQPNAGGVLGRTWVETDDMGRIFILASVDPPGPDPYDVHFIRSNNGGLSWSPPRKINDDNDDDAWQWFGTLSISPSGRLDAVWYDSRNGTMDDAELFYSYSEDQGTTWSANVAVTQSFVVNGAIWPQKMGDYIDMVSDDGGADIAFAATFNTVPMQQIQQDVYYVRVFPDCNGNGTEDLIDIQGGEPDEDGDSIPDSCKQI